MKILVACPLPDSAIADLRTLGVDTVYEPALPAERLRTALGGVAVLVTDEKRVAPETIERADSLQLIVHAGVGAGEIALEEASAQGVFVANCPTQHAYAVAELALGLLLALDRQVVESTVALREERWCRNEFMHARGLRGRTLGILGFGDIGRCLVRRARAFGLKIVAWAPGLTTEFPDLPDVEFCNWPRELARASDFVVVLDYGDEEPQRIVDTDFLNSFREGAYLIHVGRPNAVDEEALYDAIPRRKLRVAMDVRSYEPAVDNARFRCKLCTRPNVIGTQHTSAITEQAREAVGGEVVNIVRTFLVSGEVPNCLNLAERSPATWQLMLRVRDQVGVMAAILDAIRADGINAEEVVSRVFTGAKAAWCTVALDERPSTEALEAIRALDDVLHLDLRAVI